MILNTTSRLATLSSPGFDHRMTTTVLTNLAGASDHERLQVVLCHEPGEASRIELRQQTWGDGVGWFTQTKVTLQPHQLGDLRAALGGSARSAGPSRPPRSGGFVPRVVHAESA